MPTINEQRDFWDIWNRVRYSDKLVPLQRRQLDMAIEAARSFPVAIRGKLEILEVGCGTGWLAAELLPFGSVYGTDLSPDAITYGRVHFSSALRLWCGDFMGEDWPPDLQPVDLLISCGVLAHVEDQQEFIDRVASLVRPGGRFLLMTQNPFVWKRTSYLQPQGHGQIRDWPSRERVQALLAKDFTLERESSLDPGGDRGVLRVVKLTANRHVRAVLPALHARWSRVLERLGAGKDLVFFARRRMEGK